MGDSNYASLNLTKTLNNSMTNELVRHRACTSISRSSLRIALCIGYRHSLGHGRI
jgi:hypothetical protein